jgi:hypothetical protein
MQVRAWSLLSVGVSALLVAVLVMLWWYMNHFDIDPNQLSDHAAVDHYLDRYDQALSASEWSDKLPLTRIPTGIYIQSLKFFSSTEVNLTGYIWQQYTDGVNDQYKPKPGVVGFVLPEQVQSGSDIEPREVYRKRQENTEVIGWYFESTLRQPFDYYLYPFDHKTVWVRLWPREFAGSVVLTPDLDAYDATGVDDIFGIENQIVLGAWERDVTYFDYKPTCYDTNFGIKNYVGQRGFPELYYNFVIKRKSRNAFVVYLLPLFLVAALLYSAQMTVTARPDQAERHGFNTSGVLGTCAALVFVVLLAHIQLREQFAGASSVYMEYFYFLMYAVIVAVAANTYLFSTRALRKLSIIHYRDNLIPKVLFWPLLLLIMIVITLWVLSNAELGAARLSTQCASYR